jgi:hypothetical protein
MVETATYGAKLVAACITTDMVLNMFIPSSILKKKHHACAYHHMCDKAYTSTAGKTHCLARTWMQ